jgi:small-conductance mechanosensitive channel
VQITVPNGTIASGIINNFSAKPVRRIDLSIRCRLTDDLPAVKQMLLHLATSDPRVQKEPPPLVAVDELGADHLQFILRPWVGSADYAAVRGSLLEKIKLGLDRLRNGGEPSPQARPSPATAATAEIPDPRPETQPGSRWIQPRRAA